MAVVRFCNDEVRRDCSDLAWMRKRWGPIVAHRISRRLQQLEAMTTLTDLSFLPFESFEHAGGVYEVTVSDGLAIFIERGPDTPEGGTLMYTITINGLHEPAKAARSS
jgi:hypothetical protein